jgi:hypothetical protein
VVVVMVMEVVVMVVVVGVGVVKEEEEEDERTCPIRPLWELTAGVAGASQRLLGWKFRPTIRKTLSSSYPLTKKRITLLLLVRSVVYICRKRTRTWTTNRAKMQEETLPLPTRGMC